MKRSRLVLSSFVFILGCGGNVVVDHGAGGAGQGGHGGSGGAGGTMSSTLSVPPNSSTTNVTTNASTGGSCNTCAQVLAGANASQICGGSEANAYQDLLGCGCSGSGMCQAECGGNFCIHEAASSSCQQCMTASCDAELAQCDGAMEVSSAVGSTGSGMNCMTCSQFIQSGTDTSELCPSSTSIYNDLSTCICSGNCAHKCASTCQSGNTTQGCQNCVFDPDPKGCDHEWNACESD